MTTSVGRSARESSVSASAPRSPLHRVAAITTATMILIMAADIMATPIMAGPIIGAGPITGCMAAIIQRAAIPAGCGIPLGAAGGRVALAAETQSVGVSPPFASVVSQLDISEILHN